MSDENRSRVSILFGETSLSVRKLFRSFLASEGFHNLRECSKVGDVAAVIRGVAPDILIADAALPGGDLCEMISDIRNSRLGSNAFLPVIVTTWEASQPIVKRVIDSGADDLLTKPVAPATLMERILAVATNRKPFIVTSDYIGPDRRKSEARRGDSSTFHFVPPNTLGAKLEGKEPDLFLAEQEMARLLDQMNDQRLRQMAFRIAFAAAKLLPEVVAGIVTQADRDEITALPGIALELRRRIAGTEFETHAQLYDQLGSVARQVAEASASILMSPNGLKTLELLKSLAEAAMVSLNPGKGSEEMARQVADTIEKVRSRRMQVGAAPAPGG